MVTKLVFDISLQKFTVKNKIKLKRKMSSNVKKLVFDLSLQKIIVKINTYFLLCIKQCIYYVLSRF